MARRKSTALVPSMIRMREELRKRLEQQAKKNNRSLNSEMILRLEQSFVDDLKGKRDGYLLDMLLSQFTKDPELANDPAPRLRDASLEVQQLRQWMDSKFTAAAVEAAKGVAKEVAPEKEKTSEEPTSDHIRSSHPLVLGGPLSSLPYVKEKPAK